ncbi:hypothetical protein HDF16_006075 [Granulicella aggregans]|uniref:Uncharacterized protein n=1 Tax=Granulicella aggregans TaxID=474949 RepID=A0A7W8E7F1_9BACT|nr:hypothetical protein [Granulicella aggregans]MBB5061339.1 hypothetical protein [Granulicella aggregans]
MEQYTVLGATLRREASFAPDILPSIPRWETRTGIFTRFWRKGWETMRVPRLTFAALVLVVLLTMGAELKRARVGAESAGSVVLVTIDREDQSVFSSCALSLVDSTKDSMAMGGILDPKKDLAAAISLKLVGRAEGGVRLLVSSYAGPVATVDTSDLAKLPEREVILMPGVPLKVPIGASGTLILHGEWFDHIPAEVGMGIKSIDPAASELRIQQPVLLKGDMRIGEVDVWTDTRAGFDDSVYVIFPKTGRYLFSLSSTQDAIEGKIEKNRITFEYQGTKYTLLTGAPIARQEKVWVRVEPDYEMPDDPGSYGLGSISNATLTRAK